MDYSRRHLRFGWWSLLIFATLGLVLESLHAFKVPGYLDVSNETRRLMWTLAHAHGTLLGIVHVIFGLTLKAMATPTPARNPRTASLCLMGSSLLLPGGFFLGGIAFYGGDPGLGVAMVPVGGVLLLVAILWIARTASGAR
jgi:hypothetical protein